MKENIQKKLLFKITTSLLKDGGSVMGHKMVTVVDRSNHNYPKIGEIVTVVEGDTTYTYLINHYSNIYGEVKLFDLEELRSSQFADHICQERQMILAWAHNEPIWESKLFSGKISGSLLREEVAFFKRDNPNGHLKWIPIYLRWDDRTEVDLEKTQEFYKKNYNIDIFKVEDVDK